MTRFVVSILLIASLAFMFACGGGGSTITPPVDNNDRGGNQDGGTPAPDDGSDLSIVFVSATPQVGPSPLGVDFLAVIRGGVGPYNFYWDFTDDGAPDFITNGSTVTTASASFTYPFLESDDALGLTQSTFTARFWVTDSRVDTKTKKANPAIRISDPVTVVVTSGSSFKFNPVKTGVMNSALGVETIEWIFEPTKANEQPQVLDCFIFRSGDDIRFLADAADGNPPYDYRWNFDYCILKPGFNGTLFASNIDYRVDSTLTAPHYTYSYNNLTEMTEEANYRLVSLQAIDSLGNSVQQFIGIKVVPREYTPPPLPETYKVIVVTQPSVTLDDNPEPFSSGDVPILVRVDRNNIDANGMPIVPAVNFSATVSTIQSESGTPPYTYAWDFEGDGFIDTQVVAPTVPYWNSATKSLYNPYNWPGDYVCKLRVKDSVGKSVLVNIPVRSVDITGQSPVNMLKAKPFAQEKIDEFTFITGEYFSSGANIIFSTEITGGTAPYTMYWDRDFDGVFDIRPAGNPSPPGTFEDDFAVVIDPATMTPADRIAMASYDAGQLESGYYPGAVRVLDSSIPPVTVTGLIPVSVTEIPTQNSLVTDSLLPRAYHGVAAVAGDIFSIGGFTGNVALQSVDRVRWGDQSYGVDNSQTPGAVITNMPTPRGGLAVGSIENHVIATGGVTNLYGTTGVVETMYLDSVDGIWKWINRPAMGYRSSVTPKLSQHGMSSAVMRLNFGGTTGVADAEGFLVTGGRLEGGSVSGNTWFFLPHEGWPTYNPTALDPARYDFWLLLPDLPTPRYDFATATIGNWVFAIGGVTADGQVSNAVEAINLSSAVWISLPPLTVASTSNPELRIPAPRAGAIAVSHPTEEFIAVMGGYSAVDSNGDYTLVTDTLIYSPLSNLWSKSNPIDLPRAHLAGTVINNTVFAIGGENSSQAELSKFYEIRIAPNT